MSTFRKLMRGLSTILFVIAIFAGLAQSPNVIPLLLAAIYIELVSMNANA